MDYYIKIINTQIEVGPVHCSELWINHIEEIENQDLTTIKVGDDEFLMFFSQTVVYFCISRY